MTATRRSFLAVLAALPLVPRALRERTAPGRSPNVLAMAPESHEALVPMPSGDPAQVTFAPRYLRTSVTVIGSDRQTSVHVQGWRGAWVDLSFEGCDGAAIEEESPQ